MLIHFLWFTGAKRRESGKLELAELAAKDKSQSPELAELWLTVRSSQPLQLRRLIKVPIEMGITTRYFIGFTGT